MSGSDDRRTSPAPDPQATVIPSSQHPGAPLTVGQVLGGRYEVRGLLGRGGMGEVWHAFDLKLRVEVALKALREDLFGDERRRELLRQEVRAAREVVSPHVCRVFDLVEVDGHELVSMEYVDGQTLLDVLQERGPLELKEAQEIASQFLAGLEAIHKAGIVHRDIKPENIMRTRAGRVVVMDLGLAKEQQDGAGSVSGTPAYMAPEQARGAVVDARADVYAAGVVLAEMVSPGGVKDLQSRQSVWEGIHHEPAQVPDTPWAPVLKKAVAKEPAQRYATAHTLIRALEDVTLRVQGAEDLRPYPGLASFTEADAEYFFGRETEVEHMWRKLEGPARLLALVGPSGAGKSSFVRAGLLPTRRQGWECLLVTPGDHPLANLAGATARALAGDPEALERMGRFGEPEFAVEVLGRWRRHHQRTLVVVDQFEELFTLNPPDVQAALAKLLGRLPLEADVHVLVSMRDDFLSRCHDQAPLAPLFSDLTFLGTPAGAGLRRAVVQPAMKCGYRFEDDRLVEEILDEVEGERGALPLLAFALARLWGERDRDNGLLTRQAHREIGGVGGALAQHAEATMDRIGAGRVAVVREMFRNLVTAEGTRAVREWDELLSVFDAAQRAVAEEVLHELIDARLLTSYEVREGVGEPTRRVEIVHESLLGSWPRLVRWQAQDAEGALLRDQLRQAARTWEEHDRSDDLLWTGSAFREYQTWRERYAGNLSDLEESFVRAMSELMNRRRRRRRLAYGSSLTATAVIALVLGVMWRDSVRQTRRAEAEAARAEASKLVTLGRAELDSERTRALAFAIASLERADSAEGRKLALRALWEGPPATLLPGVGACPLALAFSPDGRHLAAGMGWAEQGKVAVYSRAGGPPFTLDDLAGKGFVFPVSFSPDGRQLTASAANEVGVWDTGSWRAERVLQVPEVDWAWGFFEPDGLSLVTLGWQKAPRGGRYLLYSWLLGGDGLRLIGSIDQNPIPIPPPVPDLARGLIPVGRGTTLELHRLGTFGAEPGRVIARYPKSAPLDEVPAAFDPAHDRLALHDREHNLVLWPLSGDGSRPERRIAGPQTPCWTAFSPDGTLLANAGADEAGRLWDLHGPAGTEPLRLGRAGWNVPSLAFSSEGRWLATSGWGFEARVALWPLSQRYSRALRGHEGGVSWAEFSHDGSRLFTQGLTDGEVRAWSMSNGAGIEPQVVFKRGRCWGIGLAVDPTGGFLIASFDQGVWLVPLGGGAPVELDGFPREPWMAVDPGGRLVASCEADSADRNRIVVVRDVGSGRRWELDGPGEGRVVGWDFDPQGRLLVARGEVLSRWDPATGNTEVLLREPAFLDVPSSSVGTGWSAIHSLAGDRVYVGGTTRAIVDLGDGSRTPLPLAARNFVSFDHRGTVYVAGNDKGEIRAGQVAGGEPHLLLSPESTYTFLRVSPDGHWIASKDYRHNIVRLWPMPDLSKPPLHTLPHGELLAKLKALTNLRAEPDEGSDSGYRLRADDGAYHGWATVPEWQP